MATFLMPVLAGAQSQTFSDRATWDAYVAATPTDIDFTTRDDGSLITNPANDVGLTLLSLRCVDFLDVRSYWNLSIYVLPAQPLRVNLPAGTYAFGTDISPFYLVNGTYTVRLSTGETFSFLPALQPWQADFFGVHSAQNLSWVEFEYDNTFLVLDNFSYLPGFYQPGQPCVASVTIDIKPDSQQNNVNPKSNGSLPVAVFGGPTVDVTQIDVASLRLGVTGQEASPRNNHSFFDVNGDGDIDLLLHFRIPDTGMSCSTQQLILTGSFLSGQQLIGADSINPVGCKN